MLCFLVYQESQRFQAELWPCAQSEGLTFLKARASHVHICQILDSLRMKNSTEIMEKVLKNGVGRESQEKTREQCFGSVLVP